MSSPTSPQLQVIDIPIMLFDGTTVSKATAGAAAAVLLMPNGRRYTVSQFLSKVTQLEAEYQGLIIGLQKAKKLGIRVLEIKGDSEVIFYQIKGLATIRDQQVLSLYNSALKLIRSFEKVSFELVPPEQNRSAITAVNRCIAEALGIDTQSNTSTTRAAQITPNVTRLMKLGSKATKEDYQHLSAEYDDFTGKSLTDLRQLIPDSIRDEIALHWDGKDEHLTEIYRWYLRGLSPDLAIRKVEIDTQEQQKQEEEKLPWEGELQPHHKLQDEDLELLNPFTSSEFPEITEDSTLMFPFTEEIENDEELPSNSEPTLPEPQQDKLESAHITAQHDYSKDTLPSDAKVMHIVELIGTLSLEEKSVLVQELVKIPELVNLMLKAIAEQMGGREG